MNENTSKQNSADRKLPNSKEHTENMNGLQENKLALSTDKKTLTDGFISDISSEPFNDSENGSLASCEGSSTCEKLSFKGNFGKDSSKFKKKSGEEAETEICDETNSQKLFDNESENENNEETRNLDESSLLEDALKMHDQEMEDSDDVSQKKRAEQSEDLSGGIEPVTDEADALSPSDEPSPEQGDTGEKTDMDTDTTSKETVEVLAECSKKSDLKKSGKKGAKHTDVDPDKKQSTRAAVVQKKHKRRQKKKTKKGISLPVLEVGKLLEKCEISEERKQTDLGLPALLDKETETEKPNSDHDIEDQKEHKDSKDQKDVPKLLDKETETDQPSSKKDVKANKNADSEDRGETVPALNDKVTEMEKLSSDHDIADREECKDSEDRMEDLPVLSDKKAEENLNSGDEIAEPKKEENLTPDNDIADLKVSDDQTEELPGPLGTETEKPKPSVDHDIAKSEDSEDDMPLVNIIKRTRGRKNKKTSSLKSSLPLTNGDLDEVDDYDENFSQKNTCQTISSCFVSLTRLTDKQCMEANIASIRCTILHPTIRLQRLTQVFSALAQRKCFVRLSRLPSSMIPPFGQLPFESEVQIHLDVGSVTRTIDEEDGRLDGRRVTRTVRARVKRNTPQSNSIRAKRRKTRNYTSE